MQGSLCRLPLPGRTRVVFTLVVGTVRGSYLDCSSRSRRRAGIPHSISGRDVDVVFQFSRFGGQNHNQGGPRYTPALPTVSLPCSAFPSHKKKPRGRFHLLVPSNALFLSYANNALTVEMYRQGDVSTPRTAHCPLRLTRRETNHHEEPTRRGTCPTSSMGISLRLRGGD